MFTGIPFPFPMGIPWEWESLGKWEWEWAGMGINLHGNGNDTYSHGNLFHRPFSKCKLQYSVRTRGRRIFAATALKVAYRVHRIRVGSCVFQPRRRQVNAFSALPAGCSRNTAQTWALTLQTARCFYTAICRYKRRLRL